MKIDNRELIKMYYETVKEEYPDISYNNFLDVCLSPWQFLRNEMSSGLLPTVMFKYFGNFQVYRGTAVNTLRINEDRFKRGIITKKQYDSFKKMLTKYIDEYDN